MNINDKMALKPVKLSMVRGDSEKFSVKINGLEAEDAKVEFTVRKYYDSDILIYKEATKTGEGFLISIDPDDTSDLEPRKYVYDIQLSYGNTVKTIVPCSTFEIMQEVTY